MSSLTHLNTKGEAHMVDVSDKADTARTAIAQSLVELTPAIVAAITDDNLPKGDLYATARIAGIQAAKKCSDLIPLCHPLPLSKITVDIELQGNSLVITALCKTTGKTGVEMEALTAASVAALTVYDMCKGLDKGMIIRETKLLEKSGGKSGDWSAQ
ncbi:cyclic pyranopterin monophosphate synthase MoaC [Porticoccaceae bacterium]|jgi:cyclic pyranopterin phosphate synthase|nr:cyclic pyranopterin monophosphate synthase MoaC [Porticoccaceae bacterium]MDC0002930.1 cyclic pyranopterin monophosphate synthase MoaC [Porticoccaceae bacterium]|tara:strand:- start:147 stop:617 length:471 start_codon:yes stop_codon:yes gene_type:complete